VNHSRGNSGCAVVRAEASRMGTVWWLWW